MIEAMTNIASTLERRLGPARVRLLRSAARAASDLGVSLYLVGGSVRDSAHGAGAMAATPTDLDVVYTHTPSDGLPKTPPVPTPLGSRLRGNDERPRRRCDTPHPNPLPQGERGPDFPDALAEALGGEASDRSPFGTAKLRAGGLSIDLVMARRETYAAPGALPTVEPGSLADDLARRDFSINAMAVSLSDDSWGELTDPFDGAGDLQRRTVRALHPDSFRDDATRLFRAARYAGRLRFHLEPETERLALEGAAFVDTISGDRVRHELERIFDEPRTAHILDIADGLGLLRAIHPALRPAANPEAIEGERGAAMLAGLALGLSPREAEETARRLNLGSERARVVRDTAAVRELLPSLESDLPPSRVYDLLHGRHESAVSAWNHPHPNPLPSRERGQEAPTAASGGMGPRPHGNDGGAAANLRLYLSRLRHVSTSLTGGDIVAMGVPEGPRVGQVLRELLRARLDGEVDSEEAERQLVQHLIHDADRGHGR